jgi:hypothetical protein
MADESQLWYQIINRHELSHVGTSGLVCRCTKHKDVSADRSRYAHHLEIRRADSRHAS